ncbi:uncharacterized protein LOC132377815 [Hypanus sabinus]|uniref:uncharacterized protein LOC132377815 n=1 Tax=Hypanus sabinus TaxID=79690 RepID=UPI0028C464EC|nr:uncharacterized protein LOC132377815 [Hypanus sabinus]
MQAVETLKLHVLVERSDSSSIGSLDAISHVTGHRVQQPVGLNNASGRSCFQAHQRRWNKDWNLYLRLGGAASNQGPRSHSSNKSSPLPSHVYSNGSSLCAPVAGTQRKFSVTSQQLRSLRPLYDFCSPSSGLSQKRQINWAELQPDNEREYVKRATFSIRFMLKIKKAEHRGSFSRVGLQLVTEREYMKRKRIHHTEMAE